MFFRIDDVHLDVRSVNNFTFVSLSRKNVDGIHFKLFPHVHIDRTFHMMLCLVTLTFELILGFKSAVRTYCTINLKCYANANP